MPWFRREPSHTEEELQLTQVPDDLPRDSIFAQPIRVDALTAKDVAAGALELDRDASELLLEVEA